MPIDGIHRQIAREERLGPLTDGGNCDRRHGDRRGRSVGAVDESIMLVLISILHSIISNF